MGSSQATSTDTRASLRWLCGVATNVCVETTARAAFVRDYYVVVAEDTWGAA